MNIYEFIKEKLLDKFFIQNKKKLTIYNIFKTTIILEINIKA